jgi:hypothetical protein
MTPTSTGFLIGIWTATLLIIYRLHSIEKILKQIKEILEKQ